MSIAAAMLPEFDLEMANTRKILERIPDDRLDFRPHEKSHTLGGLATHLVNLLFWVDSTMKETEFEMNTNEPPPSPPEVSSATNAVEVFDTNVAAARAAIAGASDEDMMAVWKFIKDGEAVMEMPRAAVLRGFIMNHLIHHRAQLGVYLRLTDVPVPSVYGPSADETGK